MTTTTTPNAPDVPIPAGAHIVCDWTDPDVPANMQPATVTNPDGFRYFVGTTREIPSGNPAADPFEVTIDGHQYVDGRV